MKKYGVWYTHNGCTYKVALANVISLTEDKITQILSAVGLLEERNSVSFVEEA